SPSDSRTWFTATSTGSCSIGGETMIQTPGSSSSTTARTTPSSASRRVRRSSQRLASRVRCAATRRAPLTERVDLARGIAVAPPAAALDRTLPVRRRSGGASCDTRDCATDGCRERWPGSGRLSRKSAVRSRDFRVRRLPAGVVQSNCAVSELEERAGPVEVGERFGRDEGNRGVLFDGEADHRLGQIDAVLEPPPAVGARRVLSCLEEPAADARRAEEVSVPGEEEGVDLRLLELLERALDPGRGEVALGDPLPEHAHRLLFILLALRGEERVEAGQDFARRRVRRRGLGVHDLILEVVRQELVEGRDVLLRAEQDQV